MTTTRASVQHSAKLQVPVATGDLIERARLNERLDALVSPGEGTRVLSVCAPAGFGKTTAVSEWARGLDRRRARVAWCSLDATDSHTFRFWSLLLQSVTSARPELGARGLAAPHRAGASGFLQELASALGERPLVLVLENLHEIVEPKVLADLDRFVGLLPESVRLVLTSRADPPLTSLQQLQLRGELAQLRVSELAFTASELRLLTADLDEDSQLLIWERTEGWPALVQLMLLSVRTQSGVPLTPFEDDHVLAEYLFQELLRRQDPRVQDLMLVAGVPDLLPLDLAVELTGMTDAGRVLDNLVAASGLVTRAPAPLDEQPWYRFHPLLRAYLRAELVRSDRQRAQEVHAGAARWFLDAGLPVEAVRHARAREDPVVLEGVLAAAGFGLVNAGESILLLDALAGGGGWAPAHTPWAHVVSAAALTDLGRVAEARGKLALVGPDGDAHADPTLSQAWRCVDQHLRRRKGLKVVTATKAEAAAVTSPDVRLYAEVQRGEALSWQGRTEASTEALLAAADLAEGLDRPAALVDSLVLLASNRTARSEFREATPYLDRAFAIADHHGWGASPRLAYAHLLRAWSARLRMDDLAARQHAGRARALLDPSADPTVVASINILSDVIAFEADPREFDSADRLHAIWNDFKGQRAPSLVLHAAMVDVRFSLVLHRTERVHETLDAVRSSVGECGELELMRALFEAANGHVRQALGLIRPVSSGEVPVVTPVSQLLASAFETRLAVVEGDTYAATKAARLSLELVERFDAPRAVVDFGGEQMLTLLQVERGRWGVHETLAARITGVPGHLDPPSEVLTSREFAVLVELPTLRTVDEIAGSMFVSVNTLKTHLRSVYRKLGVSSRRDAVSAARERGLL